MRSISPPGSTNAAFLVVSQISNEQFWEKGVTGMILIFITKRIFVYFDIPDSKRFKGVVTGAARIYVPNLAVSLLCNFSIDAVNL